MCTSPRLAYKKTNGQYTLAAIGTNAPIDGALTVPCGQCMECRITQTRNWATRMVLEAKMHEENCFITLTYDEDNRPKNKSLTKDDMQKFLKRYRKKLSPLKIRYYMTGEYGETTFREHYHLCIFGHMPEDKKPFKKNKHGDIIYTSEMLSKLWGKGFVTVGNFNATTAEYCAKYITKAIIGTQADQAYTITNMETGELTKRSAPFQTMSRNPGLGTTFYKQYKDGIWTTDSIVIDGRERNVPPFFDNLLKKEDPALLQAIKRKRADKNNDWINQNPDTQTRQGLKAKETIIKQKLHLKTRDAN